MKWLTPVLPYLAVGLGLFWFQNAWVTLFGFHLAILLSLLLARSPIPIKLLLKSNDIRWMILSVLLCGSSGISLYFFKSYFGIAADLPARLETLGLTKSNWAGFIAYFVLVNPFLEEYFWRGFLGNPTRNFYVSDFLYAGFHALILIGKVRTGPILYGVFLLIITGWFWRQIAREDGGLLAPVLGHMAADLTILLAVYQMTIG
jgi:membrane protease YdiL (CAAX protease family)